MPVPLRFPGVYIQELPSGVRTITGVATSITAFIGRAARGTSDATPINSFADYERLFGGLSIFSPMSFAVRDFYLNGGQQAVIVRLFHSDTTDSTPSTATITLTAAIALQAANPGSWGGNVRAALDRNVSAAAATALGVTVNDLFNLTITDSATGATEVFRNLTVVESPR